MKAKLLPAGIILAVVLYAGHAASAAQVNYVVHMSLDGLGAKYLQLFITNAPARFTNFNRLIAEGASTLNARCDYEYSETVPNHVTIFTGRPVTQPAGKPNTTHHGYNNNFPAAGDTIHNAGNTLVPYKVSFFDVAHDFGRSTALLTGKTRLDICNRSYNAANGAADGEPTGGDNGTAKIDFASITDTSGANIANEVTTLITNLNSASPRNYTFVHLAEPDLTGHSSGWRSANYSNIVATIDVQLGRIMAAIDANPVLSNNTALIITADHGGGGVIANAHTDAYHITNYTIPFFVRAPGIPANSDVYALFANRGNPGTNRTDYTTSPQPLRNIDSGNIALALLGLPPIPGSYAVPVFGGTNTPMNIARGIDGSTTVWWPTNATAFVLESADGLAGGNGWQAITNGLVNNGGMLTYTAGATNSARYYRLRKL